MRHREIRSPYPAAYRVVDIGSEHQTRFKPSRVNTIYFVAELDRAFGELARVVKSSGRIVVGLADPDVMTKLPFTEH